MGFLLSHVKIRLNGVKLEKRATAEGFTARSIQDSKIDDYTLRTCCVDALFQSISERHLCIHDFWSAFDEEYIPRSLAHSIHLNR